jgi:protein TonB
MFYGLWSFVAVPFDVGLVVEPVSIDYTRQVVETTAETKRKEKVTRKPPAPPVGPMRIGVDPGFENVVIVGRPEFVRPERRHRGMSSGTDRDVIPLVRFEPEYPPRAIARNIEGWVRVQFTIAANGSIVDPIVVAAEPAGTFEEAALAAIRRWRYQPRVEDGVAVERVGLQTVIRFDLE